MKIFIGIKKEALELVPKIRDIITKLGHEAYCFAEEEGYISDEKEMMRLTFEKNR